MVISWLNKTDDYNTMKLTPAERNILKRLIFPELFDSLLEETGMHSGSMRADIMHLVSHGYVEVLYADKITSASPFYDSDHIEDFSFKATKIGLKAIQNHAI